MRAFLAALLAASLAAACSPAPAPAPQATPEPALWRISDADSVIWLFGTVHVLRADTNWRGPRFNAAFASAGELIEETDTQDAQQNFAQLAQRYGALPPGETLASKLTNDQQAQLARVEQRLGIDPARLNGLRPWQAALALSITFAQGQGEDPHLGVEQIITPEARRRGMRLSYFETPEQQILTLADLPPQAEASFLVSSLNDIEHDNGDTARMEQAWARGDTATLGRMLDTQLREGGPEVYDALMTRRNDVWADEIARRLSGSGRIFIAVGSAHLIGPDSVVSLLRQRGIHVDGP